MAAPITQPADMTMLKGFMLTVGVVVNNDRCAVVYPMAWDGTLEDDNAIAASLLDAFQNDAMVSFLTLISNNAYISFLQAEGMRPGNVPARISFDPSYAPGTGSAGPMPSATAGLLYFIEDHRDVGFGAHKIREGKTFVPGIPRDAVAGDVVNSTWTGLAETHTNILQAGLHPATIEPDLTWYRVLAKPTSKPPAPPVDDETPLKRVFYNGGRGYVVTQRRRLIPR